MTMGKGGFGLAPFSGSGTSLVWRVRRSCLLSGDQRKPPRSSLTLVTCWASPPRRSNTHTCEPFAAPSREEVKARKCPSGLQ